MSDPRDDLAQLKAELQRLALRSEDIPGGGGGLLVGPGGFEAFIAHLQKLQPGATWRDVFPDLPSHWEAGKPETWTDRYRPVGPYDYQELPTGPLVHVPWYEGGPERLERLVAEGRAAGWGIYGAGILSAPSDSEFHAYVVLERGTSEGELHRFAAWVDGYLGFELANIPRFGTEKYFES